jgi:tetratricopeptide (TPR) repeat protein
MPKQGPRDLLLKAFALHQKGDLGAAMATYKQVLQLDRSSATAWNKIAEIHLQSGILGEAIAAYEESLKIRFDQEDVFINLSYLLHQEKRYQESLNLATRGLKLFPKSTDLLLNAANAQTELGLLEDSIANYERLSAVLADDFKVTFNLARALFKKGQRERALELFESLASAHPNIAEIQTNLASVYLSKQKLQLSLDAILKAERLGASPSTVGPTKIRLYSALEQFSKGLQYAEDILSHDPQNTSVLTATGHLLVRWGRPQDAEQFFLLAGKANPGLVEAQRGLAVCFSAQKKYEQALPVFEKILQEQPRDLDARIGIAIAYRQLEQFVEAEHYLQLDGLSHEELIPTLIERAELRAAQGDADLSRQDAQKVVDLDSLNAKAWEALGNAQSDCGLLDEAAVSYEKSLELKPESPKVKTSLALVAFRQGRFLEGLENYRYRWRNNAREVERYGQMGPEWDLSENANRLLVWGEQGVGDQILYGQALGVLTDSVKSILVELDRRLIPIFRRSFPGYEFKSQDQKTPVEAYDHHIPMPELFFQTVAVTATGKGPTPSPAYLIPDPQRVAQFKDKYQGAGRQLVGLSWKSKGGVANKSYGLADFGELFEQSDADFICLQYGEVREELRKIRERYGREIIYPDVDLFDDIDGLFALTAACDHVVTTSNVTAHISGSLGVTTSLVVPARGRGLLWYWAQLGPYNESRWYPKTIVVRGQAGQLIDFSRSGLF